MSNIFTLNWKDIVSAVISAVISAVLVYITNLTKITDVNPNTLATIALTVGSASLLKALGTTTTGNFAGVISIK